MKVGNLGSGEVAKTLASGFLKHGHEVNLGTRDVAKLAAWQKQNPRARVGSFGDAARWCSLAMLAEAARAIEPLCMLWCIPGFLHNQWTHAFKLLK